MSDQRVTRADVVAALTDGPFDVLVAGGGIVGAGVARDAALRGLRVAGSIVNTWIGMKGPDSTDSFAYDRFSYARLEQSEIWEVKASRIYVRADYTAGR